MRKFYDVIIIGAGASGMVAAITAARKGARVLILEHKDKIGKKILATGNGKCNYTNTEMQPDKFFGNSDLIKLIFDEFTYLDTIAFFKELGIKPKDKNGYLYPNSQQAISIVNALEYELKRLEIEVLLSAEVVDLTKKKNVFEVETNQYGKINSEAIIIATGLLANPKLGSDGSIFSIIKNLGHRFNPIVPSLCGFYCKGFEFKKAAGVRTDGTVRAYIDGNLIASDKGEIQFTDYGLSGIPVFQISRHLSLGLYNKQNCEIEFCLFDEMEKEELKIEIINRCNSVFNELSVNDLMNGLINNKLALAILKQCNIDIDKKTRDLSDKEIDNIVNALYANRVSVEKWRDFEFAQVCAGGILSEDVNSKTLESLILEGLYFAGEILDVDGICGGYNLQWAWTSGYIAGNNAYMK